MPKRRIEMYEYRNVIYRLKQGQSARSISKDTCFGRNKLKEIKEQATAQGWLEEDSPLPAEAEIQSLFNKQTVEDFQSKAIVHFKEIEKWALEGIQATTIHHHLVETYGFKGAYNSVQRLVKKIKASVPVKLTVPLMFSPGAAAQVDFGKGPKLYDEREERIVDTWFFVMTLSWSRHQYVELVIKQDIETWLTCHKNAFEWFNGVPGKIIIDNPKCAITKACYYDPETQRSYEALAEEYGFIISACPPRDPQKKGQVESGVKYIKKNFLPLKNLHSIQNGNKQLRAWCLSTAGNRIHGTTFEKPLTRFNDIEKHQLKSLPSSPVEIAIWQKIKLYKDCHVRFQYCRYSAPHHLYGEELWLKVTATIVMVYHNHKEVAVHTRLFKKGDISTKDEHLPPNAQAYFLQDSRWCLERSKKIGEHCYFIVENALTDPTQDLLRKAQGIISLAKKYGEARLELACRRARAFNAMNYKTVKNILKEGLDYEQIDHAEVFEQLSKVYKGHAFYQRTLEHHRH